MRDHDIRWIGQSSLTALRTGGVNRKELPGNHSSWDPEVSPTLLNKIQNEIRRAQSRDRVPTKWLGCQDQYRKLLP